jgi:hypothetical protein
MSIFSKRNVLPCVYTEDQGQNWKTNDGQLREHLGGTCKKCEPHFVSIRGHDAKGFQLFHSTCKNCELLFVSVRGSKYVTQKASNLFHGC